MSRNMGEHIRALAEAPAAVREDVEEEGSGERDASFVDGDRRVKVLGHAELLIRVDIQKVDAVIAGTNLVHVVGVGLSAGQGEVQSAFGREGVVVIDPFA